MQEIVTLRVRTGQDEKFCYDSKPHVITSKKGLKVNRPMAELAIKQNALKWDPSTGLVIEAKLYVEEDIGTALGFPSSAITKDEIKAIKDTDGLGQDHILVDGKPVKKTTITFTNVKTKEDFAKNNI